MKKKLITALLLTMIITVVACGKAEETIEPTVETVAETIVEETTVEEDESIVEEMTVEETTEEVEEDPTSESNSTAQILKLLETYDGIMTSDDELAKYAQDNCETTNGLWPEGALFSNGEYPLTARTVVSIGIEYYENCLAGNEPWDVKEWVSQQESDNKVLSMNFDVNADSVDFSTIHLWDAIYSVPYLVNQSSIELKNRTETSEYEYFNGEVSAYTYDLVLSGVEDTGFKAVYDSEGNLLNIVLPSDFELPEELYSFEQ